MDDLIIQGNNKLIYDRAQLLAWFTCSRALLELLVDYARKGIPVDFNGRDPSTAAIEFFLLLDVRGAGRHLLKGLISETNGKLKLDLKLMEEHIKSLDKELQVGHLVKDLLILEGNTQLKLDLKLTEEHVKSLDKELQVGQMDCCHSLSKACIGKEEAMAKLIELCKEKGRNIAREDYDGVPDLYNDERKMFLIFQLKLEIRLHDHIAQFIKEKPSVIE